jgi:hypothetical protein
VFNYLCRVALNLAPPLKPFKSCNKHSNAVRKMDSKDFNFPFAPYSIQIEFMNALYKCIDERKIGIFESPTGWNESHLALIVA